MSKALFIVTLIFVSLIVSLHTPSNAQVQFCPGNILKNGDFSSFTLTPNGAGNGNFPPNAVTNWIASSRTPQLANAPGCDNKPGHIRFWGNKGVGESISQTGLSIKKGYTYRLSACVKWPNPPNLTPYVRVKVRASNGLPAYTATGSTTPTVGIIGDPSNTPSIAPPGITSQSWTKVTLMDWIAPADFDTVTFNPENDFSDDDGARVTWGWLDDVCMVEVAPPPSECCVKFRPEAKLTSLGDLGGGLHNFTSSLAVNQSPITRVTADIVSSTVTYSSAKCGKDGPVSGYVISAGNVPGFSSSVPVLNGHSAMWYGGGAQVNGQSFPLQIKFPSPPVGSCRDFLRFCVKYTFTDRECRGCEVIRCYGPFKRGGSIKIFEDSTERSTVGV